MNNYKYLGLTFSTGHSFTAAMEDTPIRAKKSTLEVLRALKKINCNSPEVLSFLMHRSHLHCCMLQKSGATEIMNKLSVCTFLLVRNFSMCVIRFQMIFSYGKLGRYTVRFIKYWLKLLMQPDNFYPIKPCKMLFALHNRGKTTWVSHVKLVLCNNGFEQTWLFGCGNVQPFIKELEDRLRSSFCHR